MQVLTAILAYQYSYIARIITEPTQFQTAVAEWGLSSRVRCDKGGENTDVAWFMLSHPK
jgi:hypothetical protein